MTKKEFVDLYFQKGEFTTKVEAEKKAMAFLATIEEVLEKGDEISFLGFGKFEVTERAARTCRNPQTGEEMKVEAKKAVKYARFYPYGERGVCRFVSATDYSAKDRNEYFKSSKDLLVILQLEGVQAISNLDEILEVEGIDIIFIGPYDLSQSLGVPGDIKNPKVLNAMINIVEKAKEKNIVVGTFTDDYEMVTKWKNMGVQYISYSTDSGMFYDYSRDVYNALRMCGEKEKKSLVLDSTLSNGGQVIDWKYSDKDIKFILDKLLLII